MKALALFAFSSASLLISDATCSFAPWQNDQFAFALPFAYNKRICITDADTERSTVEGVGTFPIAFRIRTHKSIQIN